MKNKPIVLLIEDNKDQAEDFKRDAESEIGVMVIALDPPENLSDLAVLVREHNVSAVILDQKLQQYSNATYLGGDARKYLINAFPRLPVDILTYYPYTPELRGRELPAENLVPKQVLLQDESQRKLYLQGLLQRIEQYRQGILASPKLVPPSETVTREFVESLAQIHFWADGELERIVWVRSCGERQICLIEVNRTALPSETIQVFRSAPSKEVPFPMFVADVRPTEWERIRSGGISLPGEWRLKDAIVLSRPEVPPEE